MIFVDLIYRHFDILMSQYGQTNKSHAFQGCSKLVFWLHTARTGNPNTLRQIRAPQISMISTQMPPDILQMPPDIFQTSSRHPPDTPQTSPGNPRCHQTTTYANRHRQTPLDTDRCCLSMSGNVCLCVSSSVNIFIHWRWLGGVWGVSDGSLRGV